MKNTHRAERCLIIANGPGLANIPLDYLKSKPSFGVNYIHTMYPEFAPTYYSIIGGDKFSPKNITALQPMIRATNAAFISHKYADQFDGNVIPLQGKPWRILKNTPSFEWSSNPREWVGLGVTQLYVSFQLALWMGFQYALVVGLDYSYPDGPKKHMYTDDDLDIPAGTEGLGIWPSNDVLFSYMNHALRRANDEFSKAGARIINLSNPTDCLMFGTSDYTRWP